MRGGALEFLARWGVSMEGGDKQAGGRVTIQELLSKYSVYPVQYTLIFHACGQLYDTHTVQHCLTNKPSHHPIHLFNHPHPFYPTQLSHFSTHIASQHEWKCKEQNENKINYSICQTVDWTLKFKVGKLENGGFDEKGGWGVRQLIIQKIFC